MTSPTLIAPPLIGGVPQQLVTLRVASLMLGLSERTLFRRIHDGTLPARKIGQKWMIHVDDLNALGEPRGEWVVSVQPARLEMPCEDYGLARGAVPRGVEVCATP